MPPTTTTIQIITPNDDPSSSSSSPNNNTSIFLAGPTKENWRDRFTSLLQNAFFQDDAHAQQQQPTTTTPPKTITLINPDQPRWDRTWVTTDYYHEGDTRFRAQVDWELRHQAAARLVVFYFPAAGPAVLAPVSLLELGLALGSRGPASNGGNKSSSTVLVGCEQGYAYRGNVQAACARFGVPVQETLEDLVGAVVTAAAAAEAD